ncbi:cytochrome d ubiquinol oxidase subunit II [Bacillaceae bacterium]
MTDMLLAITLLWLFVFIYSIAAAIDFGAGFWSMVYRNREQTKATAIANRYLSPSWEVTNVFIVLIVVGLFSFFPGATFVLGTVLLLPGSIVLILLALRSAFLVYSHTVRRYEKTLSFVSGVTGLFIPALLILILPVSQGGFISIVNGTMQLDFVRLLASPHTYAFIVLAVSSSLFLSSLFLADYARVADESDAYRLYRRDAVLFGPITFVAGLFILVTMRWEAPWLYENLLRNVSWLVASSFAFLVGYASLFWPAKKWIGRVGRPRVVVVCVVVQFMLASTAYGKAHLPYLVFPLVTLEAGFTHPETFRALFVTYLIGFAVLAPGFVFFWRMFMKDKRYLRQS